MHGSALRKNSRSEWNGMETLPLSRVRKASFNEYIMIRKSSGERIGQTSYSYVPFHK